MDRREPSVGTYERDLFDEAPQGGARGYGARRQAAPYVDDVEQDYTEHRQTPRRGHRRVQPREEEMAYADYEDGYDHPYSEEPRFGVIDHVLAAPGKWVMAVVTAVVFCIVAVNAAFLQPGAHPAPMLSTRSAAPAEPLTQQSARLEPGLQQVTMAPSPIVPANRVIDRTASITDLQQSLADDVVDVSTATRAPYTAPAPTPRPSLTARTAPQPLPTRAAPLPPASVQQAEPRPVQTIAVDDPIGALLQPVAATPRQPIPTATQAPASANQAASAQPIVAAVQTVLADLGYAPGVVDGVVGPSTEEAIRRFQLRRALEPNGQITNDLLREIERVSGRRITS